MIEQFPFVVAMILIVIGLYTAMFKTNLIKIVMGITLIQAGVNLFLIALAYKDGGMAPIFTSAPDSRVGNMVMPVPHALTLTAIVIGLATTAMMLSFIMIIYRHYGSIDARKVRRLKE